MSEVVDLLSQESQLAKILNYSLQWRETHLSANEATMHHSPLSDKGWHFSYCLLPGPVSHSAPRVLTS